MSDTDTLLEVRNLRTYFHTDDGVVRAVDGVSFDVAKTQVVGVVGESGCGKSVTALTILRLIPSPPGRIEEGSILLHREHETVDIATLPAKGRKIREIRGAEISMIFQEPMRTLSPIYSIGYQIMESVRLHQGLSKTDAKEHAIHMLRSVGMPDPEQRVNAYPHQLSGGMRQRAMIAMALSCRPKLLNADEPTTALDVTIEAQILELVRELQREYHMSILFITHDLGVIAKMAHTVLVMYLGRIVERASTVDLFRNPAHPYTQALFRSIPGMAPAPKAKLEAISGSVPDPTVTIRGCSFAPRCPHAHDRCKTDPGYTEVGPDHAVACWLYED
ncbi:MAG: ABC transporter ATP-binding protein [Spirochaetaceae bacterium]|nr:ABC transporter ATP-binding protein [Spirochaetaceae bacterium]